MDIKVTCPHCKNKTTTQTIVETCICEECEKSFPNPGHLNWIKNAGLNKKFNLSNIPFSTLQVGMAFATTIDGLEKLDDTKVRVLYDFDCCKCECETTLLKELFRDNALNNRSNYGKIIDLKHCGCSNFRKKCSYSHMCPLYLATALTLYNENEVDDVFKSLDNANIENRNEKFKTPKFTETSPLIKWAEDISAIDTVKLFSLIESVLNNNFVSLVGETEPDKKGNIYIECFVPDKLIRYDWRYLASLSEDDLITTLLFCDIIKTKGCITNIKNIYDSRFLIDLICIIETKRRNDTYHDWKNKYWPIGYYFNPNAKDSFIYLDDIPTEFQLQIKNSSHNHLYCCVAGDNENKIDGVINYLEMLLIENKKAGGKQQLSMKTLASTMGETPKTATSTGLLKKNVLYVLTDVEEFVDACNQSIVGKIDTTSLRDIAYRKLLLQEIGKLQEDRYIVIRGSETAIKKFLNISEKIKFLYGNNIIKVSSDTMDDYFNMYQSYLSDELEIDKVELKKQFMEYFPEFQKSTVLSNEEAVYYLADYANMCGMLVFPEIERKTTPELFKNIVGLNNIKQQIEDLKNYLEFVQETKTTDLNLPAQNLHMCFLGNPGTGKTITARLIATILHKIGICKENKLVEVSRKDLVAEYIGHTAQKTQRAINNAIGGVLFIDEAYAIYKKDSERDYGAECVATLVKAMEDHKDDLVVIFAGYEKETSEFLESNSGLRSRIGYTFYFDDYSLDELIEIFVTHFTSYNFKLEDGVQELVKEIIKPFTVNKDFGNGRFVDKVIQLTLHKHSKNYKIISGHRIDMIKKIDIPTVEEVQKTIVKESGYNRMKIGF